MSKSLDTIIKANKDDLIDEATLELTHLKWLNALFTAIRHDMTDGMGFQAKTLAEIGQYLTENLSYEKELELDELKQDSKQ